MAALVLRWQLRIGLLQRESCPREREREVYINDTKSVPSANNCAEPDRGGSRVPVNIFRLAAINGSLSFSLRPTDPLPTYRSLCSTLSHASWLLILTLFYGIVQMLCVVSQQAVKTGNRPQTFCYSGVRKGSQPSAFTAHHDQTYIFVPKDSE